MCTSLRKTKRALVLKNNCECAFTLMRTNPRWRSRVMKLHHIYKIWTPTLEEALFCRRKQYFHCWAFNIPPLSLACSTILFSAALITSDGTVFDKGPLGSWKFAGNLEIAMQCHDSHTPKSLHEISHMQFELIVGFKLFKELNFCRRHPL